MKTYNCLSCNKVNLWGRSKINKFCDNACQGIHKWKHITVPRIENGECSHNSAVVLKKYLVEKYGEQCVICGQTGTHNDKPLMLQLDHIDGDSDNNYPNNLRLLCPNCHTQTENYGSKGQGSRYKKVSKRNQYLQNYKNNASVV